MTHHDRRARPLPSGLRCVVVVPTYAEAAGIRAFLDDLLHAMAAYRAGFAAVVGPHVDTPYDVVVQMYADGSRPVAGVLPMVAGLDGAEVGLGSRYVAGGAGPRRRRC